MTNIQNNFVSEKALKLATALYMVTDIMSEKEPLKWHLRERAVSLIEANNSNIVSVINDTVAILTIARIARAVSQMNADVLESEFRLLGETLKGSVRPTEEAIFTADFFAVSGTALPAPVAAVVTPVTPAVTPAPVVKLTAAPAPKIEKVLVQKDTQKDVQKDIKDTETPAIRSTYMEESKVAVKDTNDAPVEMSEMRTAREAKVQVERNKRRDTIVRLMYEKGECNVKDIAYVLKDVSEKTIQRELIAMMEEGVIAREGDRRWAVYHLA